jgi:hypothetical protein
MATTIDQHPSAAGLRLDQLAGSNRLELVVKLEVPS